MEILRPPVFGFYKGFIDTLDEMKTREGLRRHAPVIGQGLITESQLLDWHSVILRTLHGVEEVSVIHPQIPAAFKATFVSFDIFGAILPGTIYSPPNHCLVSCKQRPRCAPECVKWRTILKRTENLASCRDCISSGNRCSTGGSEWTICRRPRHQRLGKWPPSPSLDFLVGSLPLNATAP